MDINVTNTDTGDTTDTPNDLIPTALIRESLISTAVNFLHNDNVQRSSITQKQKFLRSKGLTEHEIQLAFERAGVFTNDPNNTVINFGISHHQELQQQQHQQQHLALIPQIYTKLKDFLSSAAILSSLLYTVYTVYKRFIEPFLFGRDKKKPTVEETLQKLDSKIENQIKNLSSELVRVKEEIMLTNQNDMINRELNNFKNDLDAIKGLLLNRKQFASGFSTTMLPSIPAWQLTSQHHHNANEDADKNDDADASGSGSSETEVVVKNSDSSIEIM